MATVTSRNLTKPFVELYSKYKHCINTVEFKEYVQYGRLLYAIRKDDIVNGVVNFGDLFDGPRLRVKLTEYIPYDSLDLSLGLWVLDKLHTSNDHHGIMSDLSDLKNNLLRSSESVVKKINPTSKKCKSATLKNHHKSKPRVSHAKDPIPSRTITCYRREELAGAEYVKSLPIRARLTFIEEILVRVKNDNEFCEKFLNSNNNIGGSEKVFIRMLKSSENISGNDFRLAMYYINEHYVV